MSWRQPSRERMVAAGSLAGLLIALFLYGGAWSRLMSCFQRAMVAQHEILFEAFSPVLAQAIATDDDVSRVDALQRLQRITGVRSAQIYPDANTHKGNPLFWRGQKVAYLDLHLSTAQLRSWKYTCLETAWSFSFILGILGALAGGFLSYFRDRYKKRFHQTCRRMKERRLRDREKVRQATESKWIACITQIVGRAPGGLVLLDDRQKIVAFNARAQSLVQMNPDSTGRHWLEIACSPDWAAALRESIDAPGIVITGPKQMAMARISLVSFPKSSTWISFESPSSPPSPMV